MTKQAVVFIAALIATVLCTAVTDAVKYDGVVRKEADGSYSGYMIPPYAESHASTLETLPDGRLAAAWFSGKKEEAPGCAIVFATLDNNVWSKAQTVSKREQYSNQNPVLFYDEIHSILHLFHSQAKAESGESEATIWHLESHDLGKTWTEPAMWYSEPGSFPRNRIIPNNHDNSVIFPFYSATRTNKKFHKQNYAIFGYSTPDRNLSTSEGWKMMPLAGSAYLVQPSMVYLNNTASFITFFRDRRAKNIYSSSAKVAESNDWSKPDTTVLPNNNAGIEANTLLNGNIVMVFNPQTSGRDPLAIAISKDNGKSWSCQRNLQHGQSALLLSSNDTVEDDEGGNTLTKKKSPHNE